jgi:hypothetical protein
MDSRMLVSQIWVVVSCLLDVEYLLILMLYSVLKRLSFGYKCTSASWGKKKRGVISAV